MEGRQGILECILEEETLEDFEDLDMLDVEEGEIEEQNPCVESIQGVGGGDVKMANQESQNRNPRRRVKKKHKSKKKNGSVSNVTDINRFVLDTCRRLKEKKPYLVWNAVGCLGVSALSDLVKEVDAVQACGGQMTADGKRFRAGGGILWNILKTREPKAYKEIMKKGKEFEKQFRQPNVRQPPTQKKEAPPQNTSSASYERITDDVSGSSQVQNKQQSDTGRVSVQNRIRVPVAYDDLLGADSNDESPLCMKQQDI